MGGLIRSFRDWAVRIDRRNAGGGGVDGGGGDGGGGGGGSSSAAAAAASSSSYLRWDIPTLTRALTAKPRVTHLDLSGCHVPSAQSIAVARQVSNWSPGSAHAARTTGTQTGAA